MEQWTTKTKKYNHVDYYCDVCGEQLDSADELDDGWIAPSDGTTNFELELKYRDRENNHRIMRFTNESCLCKSCKEKVVEKIFNTIKETSFNLGLKLEE